MAHASITGKFYIEDYIRVYPNEKVYDRLGNKISQQLLSTKTTISTIENFYQFAAQFVQEKLIGPRCRMRIWIWNRNSKGCRAAEIDAFDLSDHALDFAKHHFGDHARFKKCGITDLASTTQMHSILPLAAKFSNT